jgi:hypothetical protein
MSFLCFFNVSYTIQPHIIKQNHRKSITETSLRVIKVQNVQEEEQEEVQE